MLDIGGRIGFAQQMHFFSDGTTEVVETFPNIGRVVVGFVGVLRARTSVSGEEAFVRSVVLTLPGAAFDVFA